MKCPKCGGSGTVFSLPSGLNPFLMKIDQIAMSMRRVSCWECKGTGEKKK